MSDRPDAARIEQSNDISGIILSATGVERGHFIVLHDRFAIADALWDAGYRLTRVEHTHYVRGFPEFDVADIERLNPSATHRRRVYKEPWEPVPDGETERPDSITFGTDPTP
ncbi:hypothetical protein QDA11_gp91 [Microbacterium phage Jayden]|uniref:Uncharacterized protein n=1 Tax=Microbacterium phage Jayden TaxID=2656550 RepID=A0A649VRY6_9CAUD|nr:hypothetical protein QDA11_gp91 [Microbacterium phage Jayden]QGJ95310.1 hypothetical protein PBI_JAYDEN_91 [Microbacterium phage Jayden]